MIYVCIRNMFESLFFSISQKQMPKLNGELYRCYCYNIYIVRVYYISNIFSLFMAIIYVRYVMNVTIYNTVHEKN